jgi:hypothetical protein
MAGENVIGGRFDLDPASHKIANSGNVKHRGVLAENYFTVDEDGLSLEWFGHVWLNPPFKQWHLWAPKVLREWQSGRIKSIHIYMSTRTSSAKQMVQLHNAASAICHISGRVKNWGSEKVSSPTEGHLVLYLGANTDLFGKHFSRVGRVYDGRTWKPRQKT